MNHRILLVDDDKELLAALEVKLQKEGYQIDTAPDGEVDRILGLEFEGDDYITKPYNPRELILRVKGLLKRIFHFQDNPRTQEYIQVGPLSIDLGKHEVQMDGQVVELTLTEFKLLAHLIKNP